jgi:hypothetical protein
LIMATTRTISVIQLYYITHRDNVPSILEKGILCHSAIVTQKVKHTQIYDEQIVSNRQSRICPDGRSLWSFANLYFQPSNPMLYRVTHQRPVEEIAVIAVRGDVVDGEGVFISDGNAASLNSKVEPVTDTELKVILKQIRTVWWDAIDGKRKSMAECLVPEHISPDHLEAIYTPSHEAADEIRQSIGSSKLPVIPQPGMFFQPTQIIELTPTLHVLEGDMFFSRTQTLTISVNCVGVMGKGLASRAKYLFPDVFVFYNDLCRKRKMKLGKPFLYRREDSLVDRLADGPGGLSDSNGGTWFLLFPTKDHWRYNADLHGIVNGLKWIVNNEHELKMKSLALPALGCGLGGLDWKEVGPIICKQMSKLSIPVRVYLPTEKEVPKQYLTKQFLLSG